MRRILMIVIMLGLLMSTGCCGPDLKPALEKTKESLTVFKKDLYKYWDSDQFMEGKPDEIREEARQINKDLFDETMETIDTALNPKEAPNEKKEEAKEEKEVNGDG